MERPEDTISETAEVYADDIDKLICLAYAARTGGQVSNEILIDNMESFIEDYK